MRNKKKEENLLLPFLFDGLCKMCGNPVIHRPSAVGVGASTNRLTEFDWYMDSQHAHRLFTLFSRHKHLRIKNNTLSPNCQHDRKMILN